MLHLLERTNSDWWAVRMPTSRQVGYVPANYVRDLPPDSASADASDEAAATTDPKGQKPAAARTDAESSAKSTRPSLPLSPRPLPVAAGIYTYYTSIILLFIIYGVCSQFVFVQLQVCEHRMST